ncbi:MAG TPA: hypothetical protein DD658_11050 [Deltaproteobacteria bacterium]|nr:MAG: hypothetical protein A2X88_07505 [Deltaproteobacteria bacterium GWC2_65_14]HBO70609.1 hypothetical protein [Deltaproteobacteria bacterium]
MTRYPRMFLAAPAFALILALGAGGCSKEEPPAPVVRKPLAKEEATAAAAAGPALAEAAKPAAALTLYSPAGKRDPFVPFIKVEAKTARTDLSSFPPLQRYDLGELKFVGVIWGPGITKALVEDAEGRGYTVGVGTKMGSTGGVVTRITEDEIVVRETFRDYTGVKVERESSLKLQTAGGK